MIASTLVDGAFQGAVLCLASLGLSLVYAVFRFPNFSHGDLITVGAYGAAVGASVGDGAPSLAAAAAGAVLAAVAVTLLADRLAFRPLLVRRDGASIIIAAFAVGLILRNLVVLLFGSDPTDPLGRLEIATPVWNAPLFSAARLTAMERSVVLATGALIVLAHLLLRGTGLGRELRAVAENPELAGVCGIVVPRVRRLAWAIAAGFCAMAGLALILLGPVRPETGAEFLLPALAAVILGGLGSIGGTLAGAFLIGIAEAAAVHLGLAEWRQAISFALIIVVLCLRPAGLFGRAA